MNTDKRRQRRPRQGFTLLELLMVVIILGILATLAVPQYIKQVERARMTEAISMLGQIRNSEIRYRTENGAFTTSFLAMDFDPTNVSGSAFYTYAIDSVSTNIDFVASATRGGAPGGGCIANYKLKINDLGLITGKDCQTP